MFKSRFVLSSFRKMAFACLFFVMAAALAAAENPQPLSNKQNSTGIEILEGGRGEFMKVFKNHDGVFIFKDDILLKVGQWKIRTAELVYDSSAGTLYARNQISVESYEPNLTKPSAFQAQKFYWNIKEKSGTIMEVSGKIHGLTLKAPLIRQSENNKMRVEKIQFGNCDIENPHYYLTADLFVIGEDNQFSALNLKMFIGSTEVFYLPALLQLDISSGIITQFGYNNRRGAFLQNTYNMAVAGPADSIDSVKLIYDWYQLNGNMVAMEVANQAPFLSYQVYGGFIQRRQLGIDPKDSSLMTPYVLQSDGSYRINNSYWGFLDSELSSMIFHNKERQMYLKMNFIFQQYQHPNIPDEFGRRFEPETTVEALTRFENFSGDLSKLQLKWDASLDFHYKRHYVILQTQKLQNRYYDSYLPQQIILPLLQYNIEDVLWQATDFRSVVKNLEYKIHGNYSSYQYFNTGEAFKTQNDFNQTNEIASLLQISGYLSYLPRIGYGIQQQKITGNAALDSLYFAELSSYQYIGAMQTLRLGRYDIFFEAEHKWKHAFAMKREDIFGSEKAHDLKFLFNADLFEQLNFKAQTTRDNRSYFNQFSENLRWQPLELLLQYNLDLLQSNSKARDLYKLSAYESILDMQLENKLTYSLRFQKWQFNDSNLGFRLEKILFGGFSNVELLMLKFGWYHDFENLRKSFLTFELKSQIQLGSTFKLYWELRSKAEQLNRYTASDPYYRPFTEDLLHSLSILDEEQLGSSIFNLQQLSLALEKKLHKWLMKLSFDLKRSQRFFGSTNLNNIAIYYEQNIYLTFTMIDIESLGLKDAQVYRRNRGDDF